MVWEAREEICARKIERQLFEKLQNAMESPSGKNLFLKKSCVCLIGVWKIISWTVAFELDFREMAWFQRIDGLAREQTQVEQCGTYLESGQYPVGNNVGSKEN